jgi:hypothetical protein
VIIALADFTMMPLIQQCGVRDLLRTEFDMHKRVALNG